MEHARKQYYPGHQISYKQLYDILGLGNKLEFQKIIAESSEDNSMVVKSRCSRLNQTW